MWEVGAGVVFGGGLLLYGLFLLWWVVECLHGLIKAVGWSLHDERG